MEFSLAQSLEGFSEVANVPFPYMKSDPAIDNVNPGLGQIVNLYDTIVPMRGQSLHAIEMKTEQPQSSPSTDELKSQTGFGKASLDGDVLNSFMHPIVTDSIVFPKTEVTKEKDLKKKLVTKAVGEPTAKKAKVQHKFKVV